MFQVTWGDHDWDGRGKPSTHTVDTVEEATALVAHVLNPNFSTLYVEVRRVVPTS